MAEKLTQHITLRISRGEQTALWLMAEALGISTSQLIRSAVTEKLERLSAEMAAA